MLLISLAVLVRTLCLANGDGDETPCVTTANGQLCGFEENIYGYDLALFYGVPYAKRPFMDTRFLPPETAEPYHNGTFNASTLAPFCAQNVNNQMVGHIDCLYMNIYVPKLALQQKASADLPVMFFIHGGGFNQGAASVFDSRILAGVGDVIIVTTNYRLGIFGFGYLPDTDMVGNVGLLDQRMALQWVHDNIEAFGGNNDQITIFGASAGAASVSAHMAAPKSLELFKNAITESGSIMCQWGMKSGQYLAQITTDIARFSGCDNSTSAKTLECIGTKHTTVLLNAYDKYLSFNESKYQLLSPLDTDKLFFDGNAHGLAKQFNYRDKSILMGTDGDEGSTFFNGFLPGIFKDYNGLTEKKYFDYYSPQTLEFMVGLSLPGPQNAVANYYAPPRNPNYFHGIVQLYSDFVIRCCGGPDALDVVRPTASRTYAYLFNHTRDFSKLYEEYGAYHSAEVPFVFGRPIFNPNATDAEKALSKQMMKYWTNFAKTGQPTSDAQEWPSIAKQTNAAIAYKVFQVNAQQVVKGLKQAECSFWKSIYQFMPKNRQNYEY